MVVVRVEEGRVVQKRVVVERVKKELVVLNRVMVVRVVGEMVVVKRVAVVRVVPQRSVARALCGGRTMHGLEHYAARNHALARAQPQFLCATSNE